MSNLDSLKQAYRSWHDSGGASVEQWSALMADDMHLDTVAPRRSLEFAGDRTSRSDMVDYLTGILEQWEMVHFSPKTFVEQDGRIAVFGSCAYRNRATGKVAEMRIAHLWEFEAGRIVRLAEIFDTSHAALASTPD